MATLTPDKVSTAREAPEIAAAARDTVRHNGPITRLLAMVSKWNGDYIDYQMETGVWRRLAL